MVHSIQPRSWCYATWRNAFGSFPINYWCYGIEFNLFKQFPITFLMLRHPAFPRVSTYMIDVVILNFPITSSYVLDTTLLICSNNFQKTVDFCQGDLEAHRLKMRLLPCNSRGLYKGLHCGKRELNFTQFWTPFLVPLWSYEFALRHGANRNL